MFTESYSQLFWLTPSTTCALLSGLGRLGWRPPLEWADRLFLETYTHLGDYKPAELAGGWGGDFGQGESRETGREKGRWSRAQGRLVVVLCVLVQNCLQLFSMSTLEIRQVDCAAVGRSVWLLEVSCMVLPPWVFSPWGSGCTRQAHD